jgi:DoxX-like family
MGLTNLASAAGFSRSRTIAYWVATVIIAAELGVGGVWDILRIPFVRTIMEHLGYPAYFLVIMGLWKLPGAVALLVPRFP